MGCATSHDMLRHATRHNPENFARLARACYPETARDAGEGLEADERSELPVSSTL